MTDDRGPSLRAYSPTWRDRLAALLLGDERPSQGQRAAVEGILGSAGLGTSSGLVDFTPAGALFAAQEGVRAAQEGDWLGAAAGAAGLLPAAIAAGRAGRNYVANSRYIGQNPPAVPRRPFEADYPDVRAPAGTPLERDMDGRPLVAQHIAGRRVVGGHDQALAPAEIGAVIEKTTGRPPEAVPASALRPGSVGQVSVIRSSGRPTVVQVYRGLPAGARDRVVAHEAGHVVDQIAGQIPAEGLVRPLERNYSALFEGRMRDRHLTRPRNLGYSAEEAPRELSAEAVRAYLTDPNYVKSTMPGVAARIREYVNSHPELSRIIQFNALLGAGYFGGGQTSEAGASELPDQRRRALLDALTGRPATP